MAVRSSSLYLGQPAVGTQSLYVCPSGIRTIVRGWQATNGAGAANTIALSVKRGATSVLLAPVGVGIATFAQLASDHWFVMETGDELQVVTTVLGAQIIVSGAELVL